VRRPRVGHVAPHQLVGVEPPVAQRPVVAGGDHSRVGLAHGDGVDPSLVAPQGGDESALRHLPQAHGPVATARHHERLRGGDRGDGVVVPRHLPNATPARGVPQANHAVGASRDDEPPSGDEGQGGGDARVVGPGADSLTRQQVPDGERTLLGGHEEEPLPGEREEGVDLSLGSLHRLEEGAAARVPDADLVSAGRHRRVGVGGLHESADRPGQAPEDEPRVRRGAGGGVPVEINGATELARAGERDVGFHCVPEEAVEPAEELIGPGLAGVGRARFLHPAHQGGVVEVPPRPRGEAGVVRRLDVLGLGLERPAPEGVGLGGPAQVHERDGPVVEPVGRAAAAPGLAARVGAAGGALPGRSQGGRDVGEAARALLRPLPEALSEERGHLVRHRGQARPRGSAVEVLLQHLGGGEPEVPRPRPHEHLEDGEGEAPEVGPPREGLSRRLLGREVGGGARPASFDRHRVPVPRAGRERAGGAGRPRASEAEVRHLRRAVRAEEHVGGLDVPVDEALLVRVVKTPGRLDADVENGLERGETSAADPVEEASPVDELGEDERQVEGPADVVAGHHVRVQAEVDPGLRFLLEEVRSSRRLQHLGQRRLDREVESPPAVPHPVDAAHASLAEDSRDLVEAEDDVTHAPVDRRRARGARPGRWRGSGPLGDGGGERPRFRARRSLAARPDGRGRRRGLEDGRRRLLVAGGSGGREDRPAARAADLPAREVRGHAVGRRSASGAGDGEELLGHRLRAPPAGRPGTRRRSGIGRRGRPAGRDRSRTRSRRAGRDRARGGESPRRGG
jgi:hypothetical protein